MARRRKLGGATEQSFKDAVRRIQVAAASLDSTLQSGLRVIAEEIMTDVKANRPGHGVPEDTGELRRSGRVVGEVARGRLGRFGGAGRSKVSGRFQSAKMEIWLTFGGAAAPYALVQHENMQYRHTVGEHRYLVRGIERWQPDGSAAWAAVKANAQAGLNALSPQQRSRVTRRGKP